MEGVFDISSLEEGKYYYARHRGQWGVWRVGKTSQKTGVRMDDFVTDFCTQIQAKNFVYKMNGYNIKNNDD